MNKRQAKKLTVAQLKEQNKYLYARARAAEYARDSATDALNEVMLITDALICCVVELNGGGELSIPMEGLKRTMKEKKAVIGMTEDAYKIAVVDICEANTEA